MLPIQIAIVDSDELSRHGLQHIITTERRWQTLSLFTDLPSFEATLQTTLVNMVILDDTLLLVNETDGLLERWQTICQGLAVIVLSQYLGSHYIQQLFAQGVFGFILRRDCTRNTVLACLETVSRRQYYISPEASAELFRRDQHAADFGLRRTDMDVLHGLYEGLTTQEIALRTRLDERSIYRARQRLRIALGARTSEQIISLAFQRGLLALNL